jgi:hypothetical protein
MSFNVDNYPIIDDANFADVVQSGIEGGMGTGYDAANAMPFGTVANAAKITRIPERDYAEHIARQDRDESSPFHWFRRFEVPILNQADWPYCWMYGLIGAVITRYAMAGHTPPHLNAHYPAWLGKRGVKRGGWAGEGLGYVKEFGVPTMDVFSGRPSGPRSIFERGEVVASAELTKVVEFSELPRNDLNALCSVLLDPINPRPVTMGLNWWGHLVYAVKVTPRGILIANSWGSNWGEQGLSVLAWNKSVAFEQIAVERVKPRAA